jgi:hypothetical protein
MTLIQFGSLTLLGHYIMGILEVWVHGMIDDPHGKCSACLPYYTSVWVNHA